MNYEEILAKVSQNDPTLTAIGFPSGDDISKDYIIKLVQALNNNTHVTKLHFLDNHIDDECATELGKLTCDSLKELIVQNNRLSNAGLIAIANIESLTSLNVSYNGIGDEGAAAIAEHKNLIALDISFNQVGNSGLVKLLANTRLTSLIAESNSFDSDGLNNIFANKTLTEVKARTNLVSRDFHLKVLAHVRMNKNKTSLEIKESSYKENFFSNFFSSLFHTKNSISTVNPQKRELQSGKSLRK